MIGLCGAQRTGKSTLAKAYAEANGAIFVETSVSAVFKALGRDPKERFDFSTRLDIQQEVLRYLAGVYDCAPPGILAITDRTPLCMLGYTIAEAIGDAVTPDDQKRFAKYVQDCFDLANRHFSTVVLIQPGIPLVEAEGKAVANLAYMEHLNSLILGLSVDPRLKCSHFYIGREFTDMDERLMLLRHVSSMVSTNAQLLLHEHIQQGGLIH